MELRQRVHAGAHRQALIAALVAALVVLAASPVGASPSKPEAKKAFAKGVAAYQKGDFTAASEAFGKSFSLEVDPETLFAWAQAERKLEHCDKAVELYTKLVNMDLPAENKSVVSGQIAECKQILDAQKPPPPPTPEPKPIPPAPPATTSTTSTSAEGRPWYRDPVGDGLVIVGAVGLGVGAAMLVSAKSARDGISSAPDYDTAKALKDKASSRGTLGTVSLAGGGALIVGGVIWYATHSSKASTTVSGWVAPGTGGLALAGSF